MASNNSLDEIDRKILDRLQENARATNAAIADEVGLTAPSVFDRIKKLEQRGYIRGYAALVSPEALGRTLTAFIRVTVAYDPASERAYLKGLAELAQDPDVLELHNVAGEDCLIVKTKVATPAELEALIRRIRSRLPVQRSVTNIVLSSLKEGIKLSVNDRRNGA